MCGIFGVINGKHFRQGSANLCNLVANGITANAVRGSDSTGVFQLDSKNLQYFKSPVGGGEFIKLDSTYGYIHDADNSHFTVVHNRAATEGVVNKENAHPFSHVGKHENYVLGVHNGTLKQWKTKDSEFNVDSDWAIKQLADDGVEALQKFLGAYAFVWYDDREPGVLQFARNSERPMFVTFVRNQNRMIFGSEYQMLTWLADRNDIELESEIIDLSASYHYKFQIENPKLFSKQYFEQAKLGDSTFGFFSQPSNIAVPPVRTVTQRSAKQDLIDEVVALFTEGPKVVTPSPAPYVTSKEVRLAKDEGVFNMPVDFIPEAYDEKCQALWGTCEDAFGEIVTAVIRKVDKMTWDRWKVAKSLSAKIYGALEHEVADTVDTMYVLSRQSVIVPEEQPEEHPMAAAIKKSVELFQKAKDEQREATVH